jgi:hypothetical protein
MIIAFTSWSGMSVISEPDQPTESSTMIDSAMETKGGIGELLSSVLPAGPWIVFVRSPGDEVLSMGGSLVRARSEGKDVAVVYLHGGVACDSAFLPEVRRVHLNAGPGNYADVATLAVLVGEIAPATVFYPSRLEEMLTCVQQQLQ